MISNDFLRIYPLKETIFHLKHQALRCYVSQYLEQEGRVILPKHVLLPTQRSFEVYYPYEY